MATIGSRVVWKREQLGLTQADLARRMDVAQGIISRLEHDKIKEPGITFVRSLARALGVTADWLIGMYDDVPDGQRIVVAVS